MNTLPLETFNRIIILLPFGDKIEFMTVCKKWAHAIKMYCLLETIFIFSEEQVKKMENDPPESKQVERLILDNDTDPNFDLLHFFNQFPNLRVISMGNSKNTQSQAMTTPSQNSHIETLLDLNGHAMTSYFLSSNKCAHSKILHINSDEPDISIPGNIVNLFSHLPMFDTLVIDQINITFVELEILHDSSPSLSSLSL